MEPAGRTALDWIGVCFVWTPDGQHIHVLAKTVCQRHSSKAWFQTFKKNWKATWASGFLRGTWQAE